MRFASDGATAGGDVGVFTAPPRGGLDGVHLDASARGVELEGTSMPLMAATRIAAVQAYLPGWLSGLEPAHVTPTTSRELAWAVIQAARQQQRHPRILNYDRHPIELITVTLDVEWSDVLEVTESWEDADDDGGHAVNLLGRHEPTLSGHLSR